MNTKTIDIVNIALMLFSCILAFVVPFELFLFLVPILGPLHYLTEISWLHKRNYFSNGKKDYLWLFGLAILLLIFSACNFAENKSPQFLTLPLSFLCDTTRPITSEFPNASQFFIYLAFASALAFIAFKDFMPKIVFIMVAVVVGAILSSGEYFILLFAVFLPTLIHVFVFTGLFILQGALKNKSATGIASLVVFILCAISFFVVFPHFSFYKVTEYAQKAIVESGFVQLNKSIIEIFKLGEFTRETVFESNIGMGIMRFIAFAYTYHYLNWFSKTQVIKWHQVPKGQLAAVIIMWAFSIALYAYDYYTGLVALYFLSMLHVLLEFPLNYRSFVGINDEFRAMFGKRTPVRGK